MLFSRGLCVIFLCLAPSYGFRAGGRAARPGCGRLPRAAVCPAAAGRRGAVRCRAGRDDEAERGAAYYKGFVESPLSAEADSQMANRDNLTPSLKLAGGAFALMAGLVVAFFAANGGVPPPPASAAELADAAAAAGDAVERVTFEPRGITKEDTVVFVIGTVPFVWATVEFWRRIAVGVGFGTGSDSVVIDPEVDYKEGADDDQLRRFGGRRILGQDAILTARLLFAAAFFSLGLTGFLAYQVLTST